jgi:hypothetical protein
MHPLAVFTAPPIDGGWPDDYRESVALRMSVQFVLSPPLACLQAEPAAPLRHSVDSS